MSATKRKTAPLATDTERPQLFAFLQAAGFDLRRRYRPLKGAIVDTRPDPDTGTMREVTDFEAAGRKYLSRCGWDPRMVDAALLRAEAERLGRSFRPIWDFTVEDMAFQFCDAFESWSHRGVQYTSACESCGRERWNNFDRDPAPLCAECREERFAALPRCPKYGGDVSCRVAYGDHGCRCADCRAWKRASRKRRRRNGSGTPVISPTSTDTTTAVTDTTAWGNNGRSRPVTVPRLPVALRAVLAAYETALAAWDESEAERETADFERERQARPLRVRKHDRPKSATELRRQAIATLPPDVQRDYDEWERRAYGPQQEVAVQEVAVSGTSSSGEADPDGEWEDVPGIGRVRIVR